VTDLVNVNDINDRSVDRRIRAFLRSNPQLGRQGFVLMHVRMEIMDI
jgi:hypothetical protein